MGAVKVCKLSRKISEYFNQQIIFYFDFCNHKRNICVYWSTVYCTMQPNNHTSLDIRGNRTGEKHVNLSPKLRAKKKRIKINERIKKTPRNRTKKKLIFFNAIYNQTNFHFNILCLSLLFFKSSSLF